jgi:phosphatidylglycerophosphatase C
MPNPPSHPIAAFDFDGTLTHKDSVVTFLKWKVGTVAFYAKLLQRPQYLLGMIAARSRGESKLAMINWVLGETVETAFQQSVRDFFEAHKSSLLRPDALKAWEEHGRLGHERVIVTGAMERLVQPFADYLGADRLIGTRLEFDAAGKRLQSESPNCIREQKVLRLREVYGEDVQLIAAYGDTKGDFDMLQMAQQPYYRVFKARPR